MRRIEPLAFIWKASSDGLAMRIGPCMLMRRGPGSIVHHFDERIVPRRDTLVEA